VKHAGITSMGEGACVTIPIRIIPLPVKLDANDDQASEMDL